MSEIEQDQEMLTTRLSGEGIIAHRDKAYVVNMMFSAQEVDPETHEHLVDVEKSAPAWVLAAMLQSFAADAAEHFGVEEMRRMADEMEDRVERLRAAAQALADSTEEADDDDE